jgi:2-dehydro-3-deoxygluconokinase
MVRPLSLHSTSPAKRGARQSGETPEEALKLGWAHGALLTTFPGDTTMATVDQVRAFAKGGSARIQR